MFAERPNRHKAVEPQAVERPVEPASWMAEWARLVSLRIAEIEAAEMIRQSHRLPTAEAGCPQSFD